MMIECSELPNIINNMDYLIKHKLDCTAGMWEVPPSALGIPSLKHSSCCCSVAKPCPTLKPHGLQHTRLPCPSPSPGVRSNSCPLNRWCHSTSSSSVVPFSSCLQSFPASGSFLKSHSSHQVAKYWSFSFSISPSNEHPGLISFRMDWLDLFAVQGTLRSLLQHRSSKHQFFGTQLSLWSDSHIHTWLLKNP